MIEMTGDMFSTRAKAIGHGVNVHGRMGAGIAVQFRTLFPEMFRQYKALCDSNRLQPGEVHYYPHKNFDIYNIASQDLPGPNARMEWLETGLRSALWDAQERGHDLLALPQIGCGIGGLDITDVRALMLDIETGHSAQFELWTYAAPASVSADNVVD